MTGFHKTKHENSYFNPKYGLPKKGPILDYSKVHTYYFNTHNVEKNITTVDLIVHLITYKIIPPKMHIFLLTIK
jgi:hypothetical protein